MSRHILNYFKEQEDEHRNIVNSHSIESGLQEGQGTLYIDGRSLLHFMF